MSDNPNLSPEMKAVVDQITVLTNQIKEHQGKEIDRAALENRMTELFEEQRRLILENTPVLPGVTGDVQHRAIEAYQGRYQHELRDIAAKGEHRIGNWKLRASDLLMAKQLMDRAVELKEPRAKPASEDLARAVKALTSTGSATGDELVPTGMASELWQDFFAASRIVADLPTQPMPTDPFDIPLGLGDITWRKGGQGVATSGTNMATAKSTLTATEQVAEQDWTYDLDEDAVIACMPALRQRITLSGAEQMDNFVINADATATATGNINLHDDTPATDAWYLTAGQDGIRHQALVDKATQGVDVAAAIDDAHMGETLALLGKYGLNPNEARIVPSVAAYISLVGLTNVATVDKYGAAATIVTGELARYRGIPVLPSASVPNTEADGFVCKTAASNVKKQILFYNRMGWRVGFRRGLTIEVDRDIQKRMLIMVVSFRIAVAAHGTRSTAQHTAVAYDIT